MSKASLLLAAHSQIRAAHSQISLEMFQYVQAIASAIREAASSISINPRDLELQALLYLPRLMYGNSYPDTGTFIKEIERLTSVIRNRVNPYAGWREPPITPLTHPRETNFVEVSEEDALIIHENFHYLSSFRPNSFSLGLKTLRENRLAALLTLSPFDLEYITHALPPGLKESNVLVVSRVFCFDWAPLNTVSYMMGQMYKQVRLIKPEVKMLLTYINPNLAFRAASLRASNWVFFGYESGTRYAYINREYITDRELFRQFGTAEPFVLQKRLGDQFEVTKVALDPLHLYAYFLDKELYMRYTNGFEHEFRRP